MGKWNPPLGECAPLIYARACSSNERLVTLSDALREALEAHLTADEIARFEDGEACLFVREPKLAFFRHTGDGFQRADVSKTRSPRSGADARVYHDVYPSTSGEVLGRVRRQDEILAVPVEVGFGGDTMS